MDAERWRWISALYHDARARAAAERCGFLDAVCAGDRALREKVEALLADERGAETFLEAPALEAFAAPSASTADPATLFPPATSLGSYRIERLPAEVEREGGGAFSLAMIYASLGEPDSMFRWLDAAYATRSNFLPWVGAFYTETRPTGPIRGSPTCFAA